MRSRGKTKSTSTLRKKYIHLGKASQVQQLAQASQRKDKEGKTASSQRKWRVKGGKHLRARRRINIRDAFRKCESENNSGPVVEAAPQIYNQGNVAFERVAASAGAWSGTIAGLKTCLKHSLLLDWCIFCFSFKQSTTLLLRRSSMSCLREFLSK